MLLHDAVFLGGQPPRLGQDVLGDADLADIVQQRGLVDDLDMVGVQPIAARARWSTPPRSASG